MVRLRPFCSPPPPLDPLLRRFLCAVPPFPESTQYTSSTMVPLIPFIYLSISIFHIIQTRQESDLIDRRKKSPFKCSQLKWYPTIRPFLHARVFESIWGQPRFNTNLFRLLLQSKLRFDISMLHLLKVSRNHVTDANLLLNGLTSTRYDGAVISYRQICMFKSRNLWQPNLHNRYEGVAFDESKFYTNGRV